jgi:hypothetical protein
MTAITVPEGVTFDARQLMASMEDHTQASARKATDPRAGIDVVDGRAFTVSVSRESQVVLA